MSRYGYPPVKISMKDRERERERERETNERGCFYHLTVTLRLTQVENDLGCFVTGSSTKADLSSSRERGGTREDPSSIGELSWSLSRARRKREEKEEEEEEKEEEEEEEEEEVREKKRRKRGREGSLRRTPRSFILS